MEDKNTNIPSSTVQDKWKLIAIVFIVAFALCSGWVILLLIQNNDRQSKSDSLVSSCDSTIPKDKDNTTVNEPDSGDITQNNGADGYFVVQDWGIKIRMRDADKISLAMDSSMRGNPMQFMDTGAYYDSAITYTINDGVLLDGRCSQKALGSEILRLVNTGGLTNYRVVGDYAYARVSSPGLPCQFNSEDAALQGRIYEDFDISNIEQIIPFVKK